MNGDFRLDLGEINRNIESAEVICIYFPLIRKTLLVDTRYSEIEGPMIRVAPMANSIEERFRGLRRMRPRFPRPETITVIPWPKYVGSLQRLGIWDKLVQRFVASGHKDAVRTCGEVFEELLSLERQELSAVIKGEHYYTLWQSKG